MDVYTLASEVSDNFFYAVANSPGRAVLIDPIDGERAVAHLDDHDLELEVVVNTHFHPDHIGGNDTVFEHWPDAKLVAGAIDTERIESQQSRAVDRQLDGGDALEVGDVSLEIFDTPGHTPGHISLLVGHQLFCGDTVFVGGAGNCKFGGDPSVLYRTFDTVLAEMDDDVIFYPGHDYSVRNLEFALSIEPGNDRAEELLEEAKARFSELGFGPRAPLVNAGLMACCAAEADWDGFEQFYHLASQSVGNLGLGDTDLIWMAEKAAALAADHGHADAQEMARELARIHPQA